MTIEKIRAIKLSQITKISAVIGRLNCLFLSTIKVAKNLASEFELQYGVCLAEDRIRDIAVNVMLS